MLGETEGGRRRGRRRAEWLDGALQGSLACCSPQACTESGMTEQLNWIEVMLLGESLAWKLIHKIFVCEELYDMKCITMRKSPKSYVHWLPL